MIRSRRQAHRIVFVSLALILPAILVAGLAWRPELPPIGELTEDLTVQSGFASAIDAGAVLVAEGALEVALQSPTDGGAVMTIRPTSVILKPDLLVYWMPDSGGVSEVSPGADSVLVGSLAGRSPRRLTLPAGAARGEGQIVIYSLGHREVVGRFPLSSIFDSRPEER